MTANDARRAHDVLDGLFAGRILSRENEQLLRNFLPELPKQKTLAEICEDVALSLNKTNGDQWGDEAVYLESWLKELHAQLKGLKDAPANTPALPAGMRLADHEQYGRVVTAPKPDQYGVYVLLSPRPKVETGADWEYAHECELTFIDDEPAHPEFLETEADYRDAPEGTIVACEDSLPWHKFDYVWMATITCGSNSAESMSGIIRRVLRWGCGK